jgi:transposase
MEACASAHYWGRTFKGMGFTVAPIPPQHVKAFCRVHKSDGHDAIAIGEAAQRPNLHTVRSNPSANKTMLVDLAADASHGPQRDEGSRGCEGH